MTRKDHDGPYKIDVEIDRYDQNDELVETIVWTRWFEANGDEVIDEERYWELENQRG